MGSDERRPNQVKSGRQDNRAESSKVVTSLLRSLTLTRAESENLSWGKMSMKKLILLATAITFWLGAYAAAGFCQAAAEYSAATAAAASASANVGTSLGSALNNATGNVSERIGQSSTLVPQPHRPGSRARRVVVARPLPANAQAIYARQVRLGFNRTDAAPLAKEARAAQPGCVPSPAAGSAGNNATDSKTSLACKPEPQVEYPSSVTLSFPKQ